MVGGCGVIRSKEKGEKCTGEVCGGTKSGQSWCRLGEGEERIWVKDCGKRSKGVCRRGKNRN